ncbi:MAG TPA: hypothetical protein VN152_04795 [Sphingopyxis sp.]|jgi:hypothetical protein|uniref:hypothetical protein n=1 Tax=Sphingopyxis sp. TaxID=1908224 RepID=UPI0014854687|nr:hypothetical protein [Sphingopyxis sp.]MBR2170700.1 hypothetical protein [Sphingopyxis sp.]HEV7311121.1 hypothetical protein [Sphingopyxis sp.]HWT41944.1 hypothetical protein [Sphingopyxis sp.]
MSDTIMSILMLTGVLLTGGAVIIFRKGDRRRALLMLVAALVMFANVAIWLVPVK